MKASACDLQSPAAPTRSLTLYQQHIANNRNLVSDSFSEQDDPSQLEKDQALEAKM